MAISDYQAVPADNKTVPGNPEVQLGFGGFGPSAHKIQTEAIQQIMADLKVFGDYAVDRAHHIDFTTTDIASKTIPAPVNVIETFGYFAPGDAPRVSLKRISAPSVPDLWHFQSDDGAWWEIVADDLDIRWIGAKFDGTDEKDILAAALRWQGEFGGWIELPEGDLSVLSAGIEWTKSIYIRGEGMAKSRILFDNFASTVPVIYGNASVAEATLHLKDFAVIGRWGDVGIPNFDEANGLIYLFQYRNVTLERVNLKGSRSGGYVGEGVTNLYVHGCLFENMYRDSLRALNTRRATVVNNKFVNIQDDGIALSFSDGSPIIDTHAVITGNIFEDAQGINAIGARSTVISSNVFVRAMHRAINIGYGDLSFPNSAHNAVFNVTVTDNIITDGFSGTVFSAESGTSFRAIWISGLPFAAKDTVETAVAGDVIVPYPYLYTKNTDASGPNAGLFNIRVTGNQITRTLDATANYSDYGFGERLSRSGWVDPAIAVTDMMEFGIYCQCGGNGVEISDNIIDGAQKQSYLFIGSSPAGGASARNFRIRNNQFKNWSNYAINVNAVGVMEIVGNLFDGDPFHLHPQRTSTGAWTASFIQHVAIVNERTAGDLYLTVRSNTFKNMGIPYTRGGWNPGEVIWKENLLICDPASTGHSSSNKGIGFVPSPAQMDAGLVIEDSDPTSGTFKRILSICPTTVASIPTTGKWVLGMFVRDHSASGFLGWKRLTNGSNHVDGTDWRRIE